VYVTNWFQGRVHVIDGETHQQLPPIELGKGPVGIDVDPSRNQVYVAVLNRSVAPFRTGLQRITDHGDGGYAVEPFVDMLPLGTQPQDVAVDPANDRVYVANLGGGGVAPSVWVFHRSDLDLLATVRLTSPGRAIAVNGSTREVYVATDRGIEIIDGAANRWLRRIDGHPSWNIAAAPGNARQLFLAERNGSLSRLA
jgi:YVTN family beta-propeller protein